MEVVLDRLSEHRSFVGGQAPPVALEGWGELELQLWSGIQAMVQVLEQRVGTVDRGDMPCSDVLIDLALHGLPALAPEPALVRSHRQDATKLHQAVFPLDDLELGARLIKVKSLAKTDRKSDRSTRLDRHVVFFHAMQHSSITAAVKVQRTVWALDRPRRKRKCPEEPRPRIVRPIRRSVESFGLPWPLRARHNVLPYRPSANPLIHSFARSREPVAGLSTFRAHLPQPGRRWRGFSRPVRPGFACDVESSRIAAPSPARVPH